MTTETDNRAAPPAAPELDYCWAWLDTRLLNAIAAAEQRHGAPGGDPFRGLCLNARDVLSPFATPAGIPRLGDLPDGRQQSPAPLRWLQNTYGLTDFDLDVALICLAPEVDLRYERVYAYLADDVRRRRPTVELTLDLLCDSSAGKRECRARFRPDAPLLRYGVLLLDPPEDDPDAPLLAHVLRLDQQIVDVLLGQGGLDRRLAGWCRLTYPAPVDDPRVDAATLAALGAATAASQTQGSPLRVYLQGPPGSARLPAVSATAAALAIPLLHADLADATARPELLPLLFREAGLHNALLLLDGVDALRDDPAAWRKLLTALASDDRVTILAGARPWPSTGDIVTGVVTLPVATLSPQHRRHCWTDALTRHGIRLGDADLDVLAARFRLEVAQIEDAAAATAATAVLHGCTEPGLAEVSQAARNRSGHDLAALARRVRPQFTWGDLVLPPDALAQLREICDRVRHRDRVLTEWGFDRGGHGLGTSVLFTGSSGTGKTTAAQVIAGELGLDLYMIDLARVVSKYIGETEKNLDRIFTAAEDADAVLFFDEADALFGKRSEVRDSHDRYANVEVSFLLQRIEQFAGVAILATNLRQSLDEALLRRLAFSVSFPFPDEASRLRIWEVIWPDVPRSACVDLKALAHRFALSGGNIRNIALGASFLAAADGGTVRMEHLLHATRREYQKLGKALDPAELAAPS